LPTYNQLAQQVPLGEAERRTVRAGRLQIEQVLAGQDERLLVVCGPCSLHDPGAALEYAHRLRLLADQLADDLLVVMRGMVEKPRSRVGWRGMMHDPNLTGIVLGGAGPLVARTTLRSLVRAGMPVATEFVTPLLHGYIADLVSYGTLGARTVESPTHRQLAAALTMPVGMKNRTDGAIMPALNAIAVARTAQSIEIIDTDGQPVQVITGGNPHAHLILRGGDRGPNYDRQHVAAVSDLLWRGGFRGEMVVDAAHGNAGASKDHHEQARVLARIAELLRDARYPVCGVMIESQLVAGRQDLDPTHPQHLVRGQSITDPCVGWDDTRDALTSLALATHVRRRQRAGRIRAAHSTATPSRAGTRSSNGEDPAQPGRSACAS
jgi:3-deoxy-7-phosphoheptulonate synthase